jgi:hypothetical protein
VLCPHLVRQCGAVQWERTACETGKLNGRTPGRPVVRVVAVKLCPVWWEENVETAFIAPVEKSQMPPGKKLRVG